MPANPTQPSVEEVARELLREFPKGLGGGVGYIWLARFCLRFAERRVREELERAVEFIKSKRRNHDEDAYDSGFDHAIVHLAAEFRRLAAEHADTEEGR